MEKLVTAIMLRRPKAKNREILGDIFLIKLFNKLEDARELSAMINACSRLGESSTAIQLCMEIAKAKKRAEAIHAKYKQFLISGLKFASETEKIQGNGFVIINAKKEIDELKAKLKELQMKIKKYEGKRAESRKEARKKKLERQENEMMAEALLDQGILRGDTQ